MCVCVCICVCVCVCRGLDKTYYGTVTGMSALAMLQMQRCGFDAAVLRSDQNQDIAQRQLQRYPAFYQGDALTPEPHFGVA